MRMSEFILANLEAILQRWEDFARSLEAGRLMSVAALRNDAEQMLRFIASDMVSEQSGKQQRAKSLGLGPQLPDGQQSAAHDHGKARAVEHFSLTEMVSEYRALRASVTQMWLDAVAPDHENIVQLVRFNEAVDQLLAESAVRFTAKLESDSDLFTASVGHDLRNPLNAVLMSAQLLRASGTLSDRERNAAVRIEQSVTRIVGMVRDLEDFARTRVGGLLRFELEQCDIGELCRNMTDEIRASHPDRQIVFSQSGDTNVIVDQKRVAQLLSNLVANAIQHGSNDAVVTVRLVGQERFVRIQVHNEGAIEPSEIKYIFDPLHRGRKTRQQDNPGGLGLGLYIAERIALAHGGSIDVTSSEAAGTEFVVHLPRLTPPTGRHDRHLNAMNSHRSW